MPPGGKSNTPRIEDLENQAADARSRLNLLDKQFDKLEELLKKCAAAANTHNDKIIIIEERMLVIADLKSAAATVSELKTEIVGIQKDLQALQDWQAVQIREREETARRWWSFGPNIAAALITGIIGLIITVLNVGLAVALNYWFRRQ